MRPASQADRPPQVGLPTFCAVGCERQNRSAETVDFNTDIVQCRFAIPCAKIQGNVLIFVRMKDVSARSIICD